MRNPTDQGENLRNVSNRRRDFFFFWLGDPTIPHHHHHPNLPPQVDCLTLFTYPFYQTDRQTDSNLITFIRAADKKEKISWPAAIGLCRGGTPLPPPAPPGLSTQRLDHMATRSHIMVVQKGDSTKYVYVVSAFTEAPHLTLTFHKTT